MDRRMDLGAKRDRRASAWLATLERDLFQIHATDDRDIIGAVEPDLQVRIQRAASDRRERLTSHQCDPGTELMDAQTVHSEPQRDRLRSSTCLRGLPFLALRQAQGESLIEGERDDGATALDDLGTQLVQPELLRSPVELAGLLDQ